MRRDLRQLGHVQHGWRHSTLRALGTLDAPSQCRHAPDESSVEGSR